VLNDAIKKLVLKEDLTLLEATAAMNDIMLGNSTPSQIGAFLIALRMKGESVEEITGCANAMKSNALPFKLATKEKNEECYAIDTCGTGGDGGRTFNVSTAVAMIAAAAGIKVAKHGNRAVSGRSGSADVLTELGFNINMETSDAESCFEETGMAFLFAQKYHIAMKNAAPIRKELGMRTIFNILGPLTNPANIKGQVLGVFDGDITHTLAEVLLKLGRERAMVVHGMDGLDEITTTGCTKVSEVKEGRVIDYIINPEELGIPISTIDEIAGGEANENAKIILDILKGKKGAKRDIVIVNSAAALYTGKIVNNLKDGITAAEDIVESGKAFRKYLELVDFNKKVMA
jgi:anthranilate phosphoribosyltransferase